MGVYLTVAALIPARLPETVAVQLTRDDNETTVDEDIVNEFIAAAEAQVESYLGAYYDLAAVRSAAPALLTDIAATITIFKLKTRRPGTVTQEEHKGPYDAAIAQLKDIAAGKVSLGVQPHTTTDAERRVRSGGSTRKFTRDTMKVF